MYVVANKIQGEYKLNSQGKLYFICSLGMFLVTVLRVSAICRSGRVWVGIPKKCVTIFTNFVFQLDFVCLVGVEIKNTRVRGVNGPWRAIFDLIQAIHETFRHIRQNYGGINAISTIITRYNIELYLSTILNLKTQHLPSTNQKIYQI